MDQNSDKKCKFLTDEKGSRSTQRYSFQKSVWLFTIGCQCGVLTYVFHSSCITRRGLKDSDTVAMSQVLTAAKEAGHLDRQSRGCTDGMDLSWVTVRSTEEIALSRSQMMG